MKNKKVLFFFVHPAKFHLFKHLIHKLIALGYDVDIAIVKKEVLEDLLIKEGLKYRNILPNGRRSSWPFIGTLYFAFKTFIKLEKVIRQKSYNLFITDDVLVINGFFRKIKTFFFQDDDIDAVPESFFLLLFAKKIISPKCCNLGRFNSKKISYNGNHEWAYLNPKVFTPNFEIIKDLVSKNQNYFILRLVSLTASHDLNKSGITDSKVLDLINILKNYGTVYITSERELKPEFEKFRIKINPSDIHHFIYYSKILISDSQTMTSEAAMLGVPSLRFNDFVGRISYIERSEIEFDLTYGFKTKNFEGLLMKVKDLLNTGDLKGLWKEKIRKVENEFIDVNEFIFSKIEDELIKN